MALQIEITGNTAVVAEIVIPGLYQRVHLALKVGRTWLPQHDPRAGKLPGNISRALIAEEAIQAAHKVSYGDALVILRRVADRLKIPCKGITTYRLSPSCIEIWDANRPGDGGPAEIFDRVDTGRQGATEVKCFYLERIIQEEV
tara:strand:- start:948 stop:1379 length:432 start_codon:yes stop_codon:yes gene_type:complete